MKECGRLFPADNINASHSTTHPVLVISADVTFNPFSDSVRICRNPLERLLPIPAMHEYMVVGMTRPGVHPDLVVKRRISASFPMDLTPAKVAVYVMGTDNPERVEVTVGSQPVQTSPPAQESAASQTSTASKPATGEPAEATGWSTDFLLQDALSNAVTFAACRRGFPKSRHWPGFRGSRSGRTGWWLHAADRGVCQGEGCLMFFITELASRQSKWRLLAEIAPRH
jgi:hypothetical protein